jgi:hypothetical protein
MKTGEREKGRKEKSKTKIKPESSRACDFAT